MTGSSRSKLELAGEAQRRLRLARIASGLARTSVQVHPAEDEADHDVVVTLSPSDTDVEARVRALLSDMRVRIRGGEWRRA